MLLSWKFGLILAWNLESLHKNWQAIWDMCQALNKGETAQGRQVRGDCFTIAKVECPRWEMKQEARRVSCELERAWGCLDGSQVRRPRVALS